MEQPEQHLSKAPERAPRPSGRVYLHPALLVVAVLAILAALILVVFSFNLRFSAIETANKDRADLRVELEKCRGDLRVLELERAQSRDLLLLATAQEVEAEVIARVARSGTPRARDSVDAVQAVTRRYIFTHTGENRDRETIVRELCDEYKAKGLVCY